MITYQEAKKIAENYINRLDFSQQGIEVTLLESNTIEKPFGWVFFYQSIEFLQTGNPSSALMGNAPIIINRKTGEFRSTGTAYSIEKYINEYELQYLKEIKTQE